MHSKRKLEHIDHSLSLYSKRGSSMKNADIRFIPVELPNRDLSKIDLSVKVLTDLHWAKFLYINASTGGTATTFPYLFDLARISEEQGLALAVGSQSVMFKENTQAQYRNLRRQYPNLCLMANTSLNHPWEKVKEMIDVLEANVLQVHLNLAQEAVMPEGDRDYRKQLANLRSYCSMLNIPLVIKGVGYGLSSETYLKVAEYDPAAIDVAGAGGSNFVEVENKRRETPLAGVEGWGLNAMESILDISRVLDSEKTDLWASGGLYQAYQAVSCLALGAKAVGIVTPLLNFLQHKEYKALDCYFETFWEETMVIMRMLGVASIPELTRMPLILSGPLQEFCLQRGIDTHGYARRS